MKLPINAISGKKLNNYTKSHQYDNFQYCMMEAETQDL